MPTTAIKPYSPINYGVEEDDPLARAQLLEAQKNEAYAEIERLNPEVYAAPSMDYGDLIAQALLTFGPIVGGYLADGYSGGATGAEIGGAATKTYNAIDKEQDAYKRALASTQLEAQQGKLRTLDESLNKIAEARGKSLEERKVLEEKRKYDKELESTQDERDHKQALELKGTKTPTEQRGSKPLTPTAFEAQRLAESRGKKPDGTPWTAEEVMAELSSRPASDTWAMNDMLRVQGANIKAPETAVLEKFEAAKTSKYLIGKMRALTKEMAQDPGFIRALKGGKLTEFYKEPGSAAQQFYNFGLELQKQKARENDGARPSDFDFKSLTPLVSGSPILDSPESIQIMLNNLEGSSDMKFDMFRDLYGESRNLPSSVREDTRQPTANMIGNNPQVHVAPGSRGIPVMPLEEDYPGNSAAHLAALKEYNAAMAGFRRQTKANPAPIASE